MLRKLDWRSTRKRPAKVVFSRILIFLFSVNLNQTVLPKEFPKQHGPKDIAPTHGTPISTA